VSADQVIEELSRIAFARMSDVVDWGPHGVRVRDLTELPDDARAAVAEVRQTETERGAQVSVKLHDKLAALDKLARHLGMYDRGPGDRADGVAAEQVPRVKQYIRIGDLLIDF
jgi:phage terminase small subunit